MRLGWDVVDAFAGFGEFRGRDGVAKSAVERRPGRVGEGAVDLVEENRRSAPKACSSMLVKSSMSLIFCI